MGKFVGHQHFTRIRWRLNWDGSCDLPPIRNGERVVFEVAYRNEKLDVNRLVGTEQLGDRLELLLGHRRDGCCATSNAFEYRRIARPCLIEQHTGFSPSRRSGEAFSLTASSYNATNLGDKSVIERLTFGVAVVCGCCDGTASNDAAAIKHAKGEE